jgi:ABC-type lipoprotein export system ATPase subunit
LLRALHADGNTVVLVTHDVRIAEEAERVVAIRDGRIESDSATAG